MKHVWFLNIMHITKLQQSIATRQHIWLLTSKLIKKTANMTTQSSQIPNMSTVYSVSYRNAVLFICQKAEMYNMSGFGKCKLPLFHGQRVQYFHDLCLLMR